MPAPSSMEPNKIMFHVTIYNLQGPGMLYLLGVRRLDWRCCGVVAYAETSKGLLKTIRELPIVIKRSAGRVNAHVRLCANVYMTRNQTLLGMPCTTMTHTHVTCALSSDLLRYVHAPGPDRLWTLFHILLIHQVGKTQL